MFKAVTVVILIALSLSCAPGRELVPTSTPLPLEMTTKSSVGKAAWEAEWEKVVSEAKKEREVVMYTTAPSEVRADLSKAFKGRFGIKMEFVMGKGTQLVEKLFSERRAGLFLGDIYLAGGTTQVIDMKPAGLIDPMKPLLLLPEVTDDKNWWGGKPHFVDNERQHILAFTLYAAINTIINTDLVKPGEIKSYNDFLNPKWKGKIVWGDPTIPGAALRQLRGIGELIMSIDYLREIAKQEPVFIRDERMTAEWVARGKYAIGMGQKPDPVAEFIRAGAPVTFLVPKEGTYLVGGSGVISALNRPPNPNAQKVFLNWLLTKEGQTVYSKVAMLQSARVDVPTDFLDPQGVRQEGVKYFMTEEEEFLKGEEGGVALARAIFGHLIK